MVEEAACVNVSLSLVLNPRSYRRLWEDRWKSRRRETARGGSDPHGAGPTCPSPVLTASPVSPQSGPPGLSYLCLLTAPFRVWRGGRAGLWVAVPPQEESDPRNRRPRRVIGMRRTCRVSESGTSLSRPHHHAGDGGVHPGVLLRGPSRGEILVLVECTRTPTSGNTDH